MRRAAIVLMAAVLAVCGGRAGAARPTTVAVLAFDNASPALRADRLADALTADLVAGLAGLEQVQVVNRNQVNVVLAEFSLAQAGVLDPASAARLEKTFGAQYVVSGRLSGLRESMKLQVSLWRAADSQEVQSWQVDVPTDDPFAAMGRVWGELLRAAGVDASQEREAPAAGATSPPTAVIALRNLSEEARLDPLEVGLAELLEDVLSHLPGVVLVERGEISAILREQGLLVSALGERQALRIGALLGARRLVFGEFLEAGGRLTVQARLCDVETSAVIGAARVAGKTDDFPDLMQQLALRVAAAAQVSVSADASERLQAQAPVKSLEGALYRARGMAEFYQGRFAQAAEEFGRLAVVESTSDGLWQRFRSLVRTTRYDDLIQAANDCLAQRGRPLSKKDRRYLYRWIGYGHAVKKEWVRAAQAYEQAVDLGGPMVNRDRDQAGFCRARAEGKAPQAVPLKIESREALYMMMELTRVGFAARNHLDATEEKRVFETGLELSQEYPDAAWPNWFVQSLDHLEYFVASNFKPGVRRRPNSPLPVGEITLDEAEDYVRRFLARYPGSDRVHGAAHGVLGAIHSRRGHREQAAEAYLQAAANAPEPNIGTVFGREWSSTGGRVEDRDRVAMGYLRRAADALEKVPGASERVARIRQERLRRFGVGGQYGYPPDYRLREHGQEPLFPPHAALVCSPNGWFGGHGQVRSAWEPALARQGLVAHGWAPNDRTLDAGLLAQYDLVVVVGTGPCIMGPVDVEWLRGYVARGGRLLVILGAPEQSQPFVGSQRPLLSAFGYELATSDRVAEVNARPGGDLFDPPLPWVQLHGVMPLRAPEGATFWRCDQGALGTARQYVLGRVAALTGREWLEMSAFAGAPRTALDRVLEWLLAPPADPTLREAAARLRKADRLLACFYDEEEYRQRLPAAEAEWRAVLSGPCQRDVKAEGLAREARGYAGHVGYWRRISALDDPDRAALLYGRVLKEYPDTPAASAAWAGLAQATGVLPAADAGIAPSRGTFAWAATAKGVADHAYRRGELAPAADAYRAILENMPADDPFRFPAGLLLAEMEQGLGHAAEAKRLRQALADFPDYWRVGVEWFPLTADDGWTTRWGTNTGYLSSLDRKIRHAGDEP